MSLRVRPLASLSGLSSGVAMSCGVGCRRGSDPALLWLWCRPVATAPIRPLAWEKKKTLLNSLGPENNMALMEGDVGGRTADAHPSSGKRRHLKPHGTGSTWLIRGT